ncbi:hypothetical protein ASD24_20230 [Paenibacillus sp. Root52]|nr:hypothetical protein ASD24_20230 [Paenibacillus sp. Root52]
MQGSHRVSKASASLLQRIQIPPLLPRTKGVEGAMPAILGHNPWEREGQKQAPEGGSLRDQVRIRSLLLLGGLNV